MVATGGMGGGLFTQSNPEDRRVVPDEPGDRQIFKVVYVVLESQYQSSLSTACKRINAGQEKVAVECSGYILEELRDPANFEQFKKDVADANIFIGSLIFVQAHATRAHGSIRRRRRRPSEAAPPPASRAASRRARRRSSPTRWWRPSSRTARRWTRSAFSRRCRR